MHALCDMTHSYECHECHVLVSVAQVHHANHPKHLHNICTSFAPDVHLSDQSSSVVRVIFSCVRTICWLGCTSVSRLAFARHLRLVFSSLITHFQFHQHNVCSQMHKCLAPRNICTVSLSHHLRVICALFSVPSSLVFSLVMGWLRLVGSIKLQVSFEKKPNKTDYIWQKKPVILRSLPTNRSHPIAQCLVSDAQVSHVTHHLHSVCAYFQFCHHLFSV